ncbi:unnamed protein product [Trichogramma brassicae]|uniref:Uncharacterized protein n=1 Tax=Trichogramma brassicae TaxID=86971 RepID=A0A6H5IHN0_9HYME|nr:unnamed protein product [Trichogramma brassicae]
MFLRYSRDCKNDPASTTSVKIFKSTSNPSLARTTASVTPQFNEPRDECVSCVYTACVQTRRSKRLHFWTGFRGDADAAHLAEIRADAHGNDDRNDDPSDFQSQFSRCDNLQLQQGVQAPSDGIRPRDVREIVYLSNLRCIKYLIIFYRRRKKGLNDTEVLNFFLSLPKLIRPDFILYDNRRAIDFLASENVTIEDIMYNVSAANRWIYIDVVNNNITHTRRKKL